MNFAVHLSGNGVDPWRRPVSGRSLPVWWFCPSCLWKHSYSYHSVPPWHPGIPEVKTLRRCSQHFIYFFKYYCDCNYNFCLNKNLFSFQMSYIFLCYAALETNTLRVIGVFWINWQHWGGSRKTLMSSEAIRKRWQWLESLQELSVHPYW